VAIGGPGIPGISDIIADYQALVNDAFDDWSTFFLSAGGKVSQQTHLVEVRGYSVGADGRSLKDTVISTRATVQGAANSPYHPYQCSMVLTLVAGTRGKGRFGRLYLPPSCQTVGIDGTVPLTEQTNLLTAGKQLLSDLSNLPGLDAGAGIRIAGQTGTGGTLRTVDEVRVGKVYDTQRRRRRSLDEAYVKSDFSA